MSMTTPSSEGESASRARLRYERFPARHQRRVGAAKKRAVRAEGERVGGDCPEEPRFSQRARGGRIGSRRNLETPHRPGNGRRAGKMDRAAHAFVRRAHLADHAGNRAGMGPAQRPAPDPARRWITCSNSARSPADSGHAQRQKRRRPRSITAESVELENLYEVAKPCGGIRLI